MATPQAVDIITVASAAVGVAPVALAAAISTLHAATVACRECTMGAVATTGAIAITRPHPPVGPPFVVAGVSASVGPVGSLAVAVATGAPACTVTGTVTDHPLADLLFLAASASAPAGPAGPLAAATAVGTHAGTAAGAAGPCAIATVAGAPAWPSFNPYMGGAPYWSAPHIFFTTPNMTF
jgi:hypothetical protein